MVVHRSSLSTKSEPFQRRKMASFRRVYRRCKERNYWYGNDQKGNNGTKDVLSPKQSNDQVCKTVQQISTTAETNLRGSEDPNYVDKVGVGSFVGEPEETKAEKTQRSFLRRNGLTIFQGVIESPATGSSGGLLFCWDDNVFEMENHSINRRFIAVVGKFILKQFRSVLINVYGPSVEEEKESFFEELSVFISGQNLPVCIGGDFNVYLCENEKVGRAQNRFSVRIFSQFIQSSSLINLLLNGGRFTLCNNQDDPTFARLDRFLVDGQFLDAFPELIQSLIPKYISDHNAILVQDGGVDWGKKPFKLFNYLMEEEGFEEMVCHTIADCKKAGGKAGILNVLKKSKVAIKKWAGQKNKFPGASISDLEKRIHKLEEDVQQLHDSSVQGKVEELSVCRSELWRLLRIEEHIWYQNSRKKWINDGDRNTRFFHTCASVRRKRNALNALLIDGNITHDPVVIKGTVKEHFFNIFNNRSTLDVEDIGLIFPRISVDQSILLEKEFSEEEVWETLKSCDSNKAPGPDGLNLGFFKRFWSVLKGNIMQFFHRFYVGKDWEHGINHTFITLIPKGSNIGSLDDYRPISLVGGVYKILSKCLSRRIRSCIRDIISPSQFAFIPGRQILDCSLIANEGIDYWRKKGLKGCVLKVDFKKAYDTVDWPILFKVMEKMGFGSTWISWIRKCVSTASISVLVNGAPTKEFSMAKGLRQGCSLSPLLFNLVGELLNLLILRVVSEGLFSGLTVGKEEGSFKLTHLQFADDLIIFCGASKTQIMNVKRVLRVFEVMSGLQLNLKKSILFGINISQEENFHTKLAGWKVATLSLAGRLVLIKSVLSSLPTYFLSMFKIPASILMALNSIMSNFLWGGGNGSKKIHWVKWDDVCKPKNEGGLGVRNLTSMNRALLGKWSWRFANERNSVWRNFICSKYNIDSSRLLFDSKISPQSYWLWRSVVNNHYKQDSFGSKFRSLCSFHVENVGMVFFQSVLVYKVVLQAQMEFVSGIKLFGEDSLIIDPSLADSYSPYNLLKFSLIPWVPPPAGFFKLNVDAAISSDWKKSGIGGIWRDHSCTVLGSFQESAGPGPPTMLELKAIQRGISFFASAQGRVKDRLIVESDSRVAVNWINNVDSCPVVYAFVEANEAGALRLAKNKLEKQLEDLTWRLHLEKRMRVSNEDTKSVEISKLQKALESLKLELDAAKLATISECNKNAVLQNQLELSRKEKSSFEKELTMMAKMRKENALLKSSLDTLEKKNSSLELELKKAIKDANDTVEKLQELKQKNFELQNNMKSLEEKLSHLEDENLVLRQKALTPSPKSNRASFLKSFSEKYGSALGLPQTDRKQAYESPTPSKLIVPFSHSMSESRRLKLTAERQQENYEFLSRCIKENLGFHNGKPLAACIIYKCLHYWHSFESERTAIFDYIIEGINDVLKVGPENVTLPYWLSNTSALLCLLQKNLRSNGFLSAATQRSGGNTGLAGRVSYGLKSPFKYLGFEDGMSHIDARYPAILFKQQLTACVEKIFGLIRDNIKKELSPLLGLCIQVPKNARMLAGKSRSPGGFTQQSPSSQWDSIIKFLDSLMDRLRENHVSSFFIRKLITQVFSFINMSLFNSLLLRRECCSFSNGEYVKSGLAELEKWIVNAKEEYAGTSWHELNYIRQAVGFLVIHQKRKKSLAEISNDLCPALTIRQIYRISTMYWDDKYGTQSVSNEVVAEMREMLNKDSQYLASNSFLLDDDLSIPFSTEDIDIAIPAIDPSSIELPEFLSEYSCAQCLMQNQK
ncbi:Myosin-15 [Hibiscus syriacus]|uniref:Myosin-15 n=1 Tax=Hibiscus syriacus TaxID=106335 RepID=A0A6A2YG68_HIBSY|nr:Myosin-15 [Hibiscus syriacus]